MELHFRLRGSVQGVGFRPWIRCVARGLDVRGTVSNAPDGVWIDVSGSANSLGVLRKQLEQPPLPGARVESIESVASTGPACASHVSESVGFEIAESHTRGTEDVADVALAPDLPTCASCLGELTTPSTRRYHHPFIACAQCGPRYTIARDLPWDRVRTSMADFPLCAECGAEYSDPDDRRFHAESTSCPVCGPTLQGVDWDGGVSARDEVALVQTLEALARGEVVAIQGIGGFHLACDASSERAVLRLRERKRRPRRPLAVMVRSLAEVEKHALVNADERKLLGSDARPIVLLRRRSDSALAPSLAPGSPMLGLLLAYAPLHWLLLDGFGGPLVMTSANRSGEPIVYRSRDAVRTLSGVADRVLANDREIVAPCDDSVAIAAHSGPIVLRRSRGHVPRPIRLAQPLERPVLAFGGQWSNTICVASGDRAWPSAHIGDIESPESVERLEETVQRWLAWLNVEPAIVAHDLHPGYETTKLALGWPGAPAIGVQHHHAHMAAVLGEHAAEGPALGLVWDGTGAGPDGTAWGGELLVGDRRAVRRLATFRPIPLAGGAQAIREPWRLALALLQDAFESNAPVRAIDLFDRVPRDQCEGVAELIERPELCVTAHGVGRYFDAVGALLLQRPVATYQGELAQALNFLATGRPAQPYPFELNTVASPWEIDMRPCVRALLEDLMSGRAPAQIADRFHATLAAAGEAAVREALGAAPEVSAGVRDGRARIVLSGGCFQNPILRDALESRLGRDLAILNPVELPPGDGGLAFGQVLVADALASMPTWPANREA